MCLHLEVLPQKSIWSQKETNFLSISVDEVRVWTLKSLFFFFLWLNIREYRPVVPVSGGRCICKLSHYRFTARPPGLSGGD